MARKVRKKKKDGTMKKAGKSLGRSAVIGFFGGLIWGFVALICYLLNFTSIGPSLLFSPFPPGAWRNGTGGQFLAVAGISVLSVPFALIYRFTLSRLKSIWAGIGTGVLLWGIVFIALKPWLRGLPVFYRLGWNTCTTTLCLFILYGLFIGYSIAFMIQENSGRENYSNN